MRFTLFTTSYNQLNMLHLLKNRPNLQKALANTGWLFADRILRMGVGLLVGVWVARYLGPEQFGLFNYATAFVALFGAVAGLGLNGIVVRDLVKHPEQANTTLGTTFLLQILGGFLALLLAVLAIDWVRPDEPLMKMLVIILASVMVFKATETVKFWFESQVQSKYCVWVENAAFLIFAAIKVMLILQHAPLIAFVWVVLGEAALVAVALLGMYAWKEKQLLAWRFDGIRAKQLLKDSWPLILSGTFVLLNLSVDKLLLGHYMSSNEIGIYSAANVIVNTWLFIPMVIGGSFSPRLTKLFHEDKERYKINTIKLYKLFRLGSFSIATIIFLLSDQLVSILYGNAYLEASRVLSINIWSIIFISIVSLRGRLLIIENKQNIVALLVCLGCFTNFILGVFFIPKFGSLGAAYACSISWGLNAILFPFFIKKTRNHAIMSSGLLLNR